jgi:hypothetical protein
LADHPLGRRTHARWSITGGPCILDLSMSYDSVGRLVAEKGGGAPGSTCPIYDTTYLFWDSAKRPTSATSSVQLFTVNGPPAEPCFGQSLVYSYDDAARMVNLLSTGGTNNCSRSMTSEAFDRDGILITMPTNSPSSSSTVSTVLATDRICGE